jgi:predicted RNA binding protein YcfA (HicA-like mRNA interferase family)
LLIVSPMVSFRLLRSVFLSPFQMSNWPASKARRVVAALERIGWRVKRQRGSHRLLTRSDWPDYELTFQDQEEIGPRMLVSEGSQADRTETGRPVIPYLRR